MSSRMKVTVIMAVYNAAPWLDRSLGSLLQPRHTTLETLCVDDCSTDNSLSILQAYAVQDPRIRVLTSENNAGPAVARNKAIAVMTGAVAAFLDADDWLSADAIEKAVMTFKSHPETDCVLFSCIIRQPDGTDKPYPQSDFEVKSGYEAFVDSLTWAIHGVYVARAELYQRYPYDTTCRTFSDDNTTRLHYYISREVRCCEGRYYYQYNPQSISNNTTISRLDYLRANESMKRQLVSLGVSDAVLRLYERQRWLILVDAYYFYHTHRHHFTPQERDYCLREIRRVWSCIDLSLLPRKLCMKLGYMPLRFSWRLFCWQEELYFGLKKLL